MRAHVISSHVVWPEHIQDHQLFGYLCAQPPVVSNSKASIEKWIEQHSPEVGESGPGEGSTVWLEICALVIQAEHAHKDRVSTKMRLAGYQEAHVNWLRTWSGSVRVLADRGESQHQT